jgi:hypothetical protein
MNSMVLFASVSFGVLTYLVVRLVGPSTGSGSDKRRTGWSLTWRIVVAGVLSPPAMALAGIPASLFGGETPDVTAQAWVLGIELGLLWLAGAWVLITHLRRRDAHEVEPMTPFARIYPAAFLAVMAVFFAFTADELPIGSVLYSLACLAGAVAILSVLHSGRRRADVLAG